MVVIPYPYSHTIKKAERWRIGAFELWCWRRVLRVPWTARRSNLVHPKGDQSWVFTGRIDVEAETPILWPPDVKSWLIWKDPDAVKDWGQEEKGMTEDEMVGWHLWLDGHEFEQALGDGEGQGSLVCCSPWGCIELYSTEQLNKVDIYKPTDPRCQKQFNWWVRNHIWNQILHWHVSKK